MTLEFRLFVQNGIDDILSRYVLYTNQLNITIITHRTTFWHQRDDIYFLSSTMHARKMNNVHSHYDLLRFRNKNHRFMTPVFNVWQIKCTSSCFPSTMC